MVSSTQVIVHETATNTSKHYNTEDSQVRANELLDFMRFEDWSAFCLVHLFTNRDLPGGLLGLANIASSNFDQTGGVCSTSELILCPVGICCWFIRGLPVCVCSAGFLDNNFSPARRVIYNTGLTTLRNRGQQMVMSELVRVTGHELGHNWGSHHDPNTPDCTNRWLMYEYVQDGSQSTHTVSQINSQ